jgi:hypothetical protein
VSLPERRILQEVVAPTANSKQAGNIHNETAFISLFMAAYLTAVARGVKLPGFAVDRDVARSYRPRMKHFLSTVCMAGMLIVGCSKPTVVDTGRLERVFKTSEQSAQAMVEKVSTAISQTNYPAAMASLQKLSHQPKLTDEQQIAVRDAMTAVQQLMTTKRPSGDR